MNTGDDVTLAGLRVCPDLDSILYALAGVNDAERGWGRADEAERAAEEMTAWGVGWPWFTLGDRDLGACITRSHWLAEGVGLAEVVRRLASRWDLGVALLPMSEQPIETHVHTAEQGRMHFQEWWVRHRAGLRAERFELDGIGAATPAPGVLAAIADADAVLVAPSNPVVSIGPILAVPGIREALVATAAPVVGLSPIVGGRVVRGMADACLEAIGVDTDAAAVAQHYGAELLDGWLVDTADAGAAGRLTAEGIPTIARPLLFTSVEETAAIARDALALAQR
ncbi:2-phospho-L-lactate transferase [Arenivirga flava]|uniref:2-phospho-L-lactate transferase n=1 Tax=Arenivirga flava TaxID=1930060 RepID=A0AA37UKM5_9MICO|nr:2-phospho-L-lactate transferase [Arenivirga flava]